MNPPGPDHEHRWRVLFGPSQVPVARRERWRAAGGAAAGVLFAALLSHVAALQWGLSPWLMAPLGASAVLVFALPASPLAQPWAVLAGNTSSALVGVACAAWAGPLWLASPLAVAVAMLTMFLLRALHPPGGAVALLAVLGGAAEPAFAFFPVAANSALLVLAGIAWNRLTGRDYPHRQSPPVTSSASRFSAADLDAALAHYNQMLDVSRADLEDLLLRAEAHAYQRQLGDLTCADVMTREVVTADYAMPLEEAWGLMRGRRIKALPVVDAARRIIGIVTAGDFLRHAQLDRLGGLRGRLQSFMRATTGNHSDKAEVVGQIMSRRVQVATMTRPLVDLLPLFAQGGHHHVPIVDGEQRLAGILTQTDLIRVLYTSTGPAGGRS